MDIKVDRKDSASIIVQRILVQYPKMLYTSDMQPLDACGNYYMQNYPTLQLMGDGIMIGF